MKFLKTALLATAIVSSLPCSAVRVTIVGPGMQKPKQSPLNEPVENENVFSYAAGNMHRIWNNDAKKGFLLLMGCHFRLLNKGYDAENMPLSSFVKNPANIATHPLRFIDDGIIGHVGEGNKPAYGVLGTTWSWVPKIDQAMVRVDQAKRKVEAWFGWFDTNLQQLNRAEVSARAMYNGAQTFMETYLPHISFDKA